MCVCARVRVCARECAAMYIHKNSCQRCIFFQLSVPCVVVAVLLFAPLAGTHQYLARSSSAVDRNAAPTQVSGH